ncbi:hypothetical protein [Mucilaginibacter panaciglaebae]|uniref:hypothetical protein n=1 Tax=Mucilaginibacter panaciglaebae TaxID=502331 RepID=UPI0031EF3777
MKRFKINTTWEEDEKERREFFEGLSFSERLRCFYKLKEKFSFDKQVYPKGKIFKIHHLTDAI